MVHSKFFIISLYKKLGDAGQEHKAQIRVACLQRTVKITHHITKYGEILLLVHHIQQGRIILVDENYHLAVGMFAGTHDECLHPVIKSNRPFQLSVLFSHVQRAAHPACFPMFPCPHAWSDSCQSAAPDIPSIRFPAFRWQTL